MKAFSDFFRAMGAIFAPPFNGLAAVVLIFYVWAQLVYPHNDILRGNLPDPDDYMYLAQTMDWLNGQGWYDNIQYRMDPPAGVPIHFSRLAQIPLAAMIFLFSQAGLPMRGAATVAALIEPLIFLGLFLRVLRQWTAYLAPARWAGASSLIALFAPGLLFEFMPGHVDHHGLIVLLVATALVLVLRMLQEPQNRKAAAGAGVIMALALIVALETLPWFLLLSAFIGAWGLKQGGAAAKSGAAFGAAQLAGCAAGLAITRPPAQWGETDILTYSAVYVLLAVGVAAPFLAAAGVAHRPLAVRAGIGGGLAVLSGGVFIHFFPELTAGPYGAIDPQLAPLLLNEMEEARPIWQTEHAATHILNFLSLSLIALPLAAVFWTRARGAAQAQWGLTLGVLAAATALTGFYQYRFLGMACAAAVPVLGAVLARGWAWIARRYSARKKFWAEVGLLMIVAPLPALILPALVDGRSLFPGMVLFPVDSGHTPCDMSRLERVLRDPKGLGARRQTIISMMELGPEILFRSDNAVLAAPFHMNVQGNLDAMRFLSTPYDAEAESIARRRRAEWVLACRFVPLPYLGGEKRDKTDAPRLAERLFTGPLPPWLRPVALPGIDNFVLFKILPPDGAEETVPEKMRRK